MGSTLQERVTARDHWFGCGTGLVALPDSICFAEQSRCEVYELHDGRSSDHRPRRDRTARHHGGGQEAVRFCLSVDEDGQQAHHPCPKARQLDDADFAEEKQKTGAAPLGPPRSLQTGRTFPGIA